MLTASPECFPIWNFQFFTGLCDQPHIPPPIFSLASNCTPSPDWPRSKHEACDAIPVADALCTLVGFAFPVPISSPGHRPGSTRQQHAPPDTQSASADPELGLHLRRNRNGG